MKKTILVILAMLLALSIVNAQVEEPTITYLGNQSVDISEAHCITDGTDLTCIGGGFPYEVYEYDVSANTITTSNLSTGMSSISMGNNGDFWLYNGVVYGAGHKEGTANFSLESYSSDYSIHTELVNTNLGGTPRVRCEIKPSTDEVYCFIGNIAGQPLRAYVYDIGSDTFTFQNTTPFASNRRIFDLQFNPADTDEVWIIGGQNDSNVATDEIWAYDTVALTTTFVGNLGLKGEVYECIYYNNVLYCPNGADADTTNRKQIPYYDTNTSTGGILTTEFPNYYSYGGCGQVTASTYYCIGGWGYLDWDDFTHEIYKIDWTPESEPEEPAGLTPYNATHSTSSIVGVVIDFGVEFGIQLIAFAGLVALVGLAVWVLHQ